MCSELLYLQHMHYEIHEDVFVNFLMFCSICISFLKLCTNELGFG